MSCNLDSLNIKKPLRLMTMAVAVTLVTGCYELNDKPAYVAGEPQSQYYDGADDDLLTAGLGVTGLQGAAPAVLDPASPTAAELRRLAIYNNYRALLDTTTAGGFGRLYGPNIVAGVEQVHGGKISGTEYLVSTLQQAYDDGSVTVMVQIPDSFNPASPCIVLGASSGSRGVYGAIGTAGEWGLNHGCVVAYTDKGTGNGIHDLDSDQVTLGNGLLAAAVVAGANSQFTAADPDLDDFKAAYPHRVAYKHAHSGQNPEKDWGKFVLQAAEVALYVLNLPENYGFELPTGQVIRTLTADNTWIIAASVSNGGGASLRAAEQDHKGLIDAVVASEPNVTPRASLTRKLKVVHGDLTWDHLGRPLYDYTSLLDLLQPCASVDADPFAVPAGSEARCQALADAGLISGITIEEMVADARQQLREYGLVPEQDFTQHANNTIQVPQSISVTYANAYGGFGVADNLCDFSMAFTDATAEPAPAQQAQIALAFATGNGIPPTAGVQLVDNKTGLIDRLSSADQNLAGHLCLRELAIGHGAEAQKVAKGIKAIESDPRRLKVPAIIVHGRADAIIPINHASRPYSILAVNSEAKHSAKGDLRYVEVLNAHHLDLLNGLFPGYQTRYVGLHYYFTQALDQMWLHLTAGEPLPGHQVIPTVPRNPGEQLEPANLPPIKAVDQVADNCRILIAEKQMTVPADCR